MPDERTNSTITWLNSPIRGNQKAQTVIDMIQVGQWYGRHQESALKKPHYRPTVKFRKLDKDILTKLQTKSDDDESHNAELDDEESGSEDAGGEEETLTSTQFTAEASAACQTPFKVDPCIDLKSHALMDMISLIPDSERSAGHPSQAEAIPTMGERNMSVAEAFDSW